MLFSLALAVAFAARGAPSRPPPNIVFILSDDHGWADVGWHGAEIKTPNLDQLAATGARLEQFYAQPVCSPTRAALLTGRYPMRYGLQVGVIRPWADYGLPLDERTLPQMLKEVGYATFLTGKWHLGHSQPAYLPTRRGFDHQYGHYNGELDYFTHVRDGGFDWHRDDRVSREEGYTTFLIAQEAVRIIRDQPANRPLFLYVAFNAVHAPHQVPERYKAPYASLAEPRRTYAGMVAAEDEAVGQIVAALAAKGLRENTLIVWSSDNGGPRPGEVTSNGPLRAGKGTVYEGGVRVCAFVNWPGQIKPGSTVNAPLHMVDWFPTLGRLAGAKVDGNLPLDGRDAWAAITANQPSPHDAILLNTSPKTGAIRMGDWKLVMGGGVTETDDGEATPAAKAGRKKSAPKASAAHALELYNLAADPGEKNNLASANPAKASELLARYEAFAREAVPPRNKPRPSDFVVPKVWGESN